MRSVESKVCSIEETEQALLKRHKNWILLEAPAFQPRSATGDIGIAAACAEQSRREQIPIDRGIGLCPFVVTVSNGRRPPQWRPRSYSARNPRAVQLITNGDRPGGILDRRSHSDERRSHIGKRAPCGYNHSGRKPQRRFQRSKLEKAGRAALRMRFPPQQGCQMQQVQQVQI